MFKFIIKGVVQGVGFRPYIYNACKKAGLKGYVQNTGEGVVVEVDDKKRFVEILKDAPPLARVDSYDIKETKNSFVDFSIRKSEGEGFAEIPPDLFLCRECYEEFNNPKNRRYKYFFITCTNCGPRFSIARKSPYDRQTTSMNDFEMCKECKKEYVDPEDRRYHAQTIGCHNCGPGLKLILEGKEVKGCSEIECVKEITALLKRKEVVAIKGVGGFHLSCILTLNSIRKLRKITGREHKPFAVMCKDLEMAEELAFISEKEKEILLSVERPIVILKKRERLRPLLREVSELDTIGIMLPYTALHHLFFDFIDEPIIMTSSNRSDEPITIEENEQTVKNIIFHNRIIENRVDDSLVKVIHNKPLLLRRSRGFVPKSIPITIRDFPNEEVYKEEISEKSTAGKSTAGKNTSGKERDKKRVTKNNSEKQILSLGAEMNSSFCVYKDGKAIISQYLGNTSNANAFSHYKKTIKKFLQFTHCKPDLILCDLHPEYNTSRFGEELSVSNGLSLIRVQHHKAHAYSVAAEKGLDSFNDFVAIVCDGLGYGEDGTIWGGEIFHNDVRIGHLEEQYLLGGDSAAQYPEKMLFSILSKFMPLEKCKEYLKLFSEEEIMLMKKQLEKRFNCPVTTSCGRILDAASSLLGFCNERTYDGRPAMLLEANSTTPFHIKPVIEKNVLMTTPLFSFLVKNIHKDKRRLSATVQLYLAKGLFQIAAQFNKPIIFSGGCAYNNIMTSFMLRKGVHINNKVPCGDGGISFGQVAYYLANHLADSRNKVS